MTGMQTAKIDFYLKYTSKKVVIKLFLFYFLSNSEKGTQNNKSRSIFDSSN